MSWFAFAGLLHASFIVGGCIMVIIGYVGKPKGGAVVLMSLSYALMTCAAVHTFVGISDFTFKTGVQAIAFLTGQYALWVLIKPTPPLRKEQKRQRDEVLMSILA